MQTLPDLSGAVRSRGHLTESRAYHQALADIVQASALISPILHRMKNWGLPECWLVSGAIYGVVWNHLTGRPEAHGLNDIDILYFDNDLSWEAEDVVIREASTVFSSDLPIQIRNQARVHLWFPKKFGMAYPDLRRTTDAIALFAARAHCVGLRLTDKLEICAPFGLHDMFNLRLTPNTALPNAKTYNEKTQRQLANWPELAVSPWPEPA